MQQGAGTGGFAFQHLLDEIDATARAVEFVALELVGGAGGVAETAMHALAQNGVGLLALGGFQQFCAESSLHKRYILPVSNTPCGSSARRMR